MTSLSKKLTRTTTKISRSKKTKKRKTLNLSSNNLQIQIDPKMIQITIKVLPRHPKDSMITGLETNSARSNSNSSNSTNSPRSNRNKAISSKDDLSKISSTSSMINSSVINTNNITRADSTHSSNQMICIWVVRHSTPNLSISSNGNPMTTTTISLMTSMMSIHLQLLRKHSCLSNHLCRHRQPSSTTPQNLCRLHQRSSNQHPKPPPKAINSSGPTIPITTSSSITEKTLINIKARWTLLNEIIEDSRSILDWNWKFYTLSPWVLKFWTNLFNSTKKN